MAKKTRPKPKGDAAKPAAPIGRPSGFSETIADKICERLANGESLRAICRDEGMPGISTVLRWVGADTVFREQYARAREAQCDFLADETLEIGDAATAEDVHVARLRCDNRRWYTGKVAPKKYGDKIQAEVTGKDGGPMEIRPVINMTGRPDPKDA